MTNFETTPYLRSGSAPVRCFSGSGSIKFGGSGSIHFGGSGSAPLFSSGS